MSELMLAYSTSLSSGQASFKKERTQMSMHIKTGPFLIEMVSLLHSTVEFYTGHILPVEMVDD